LAEMFRARAIYATAEQAQQYSASGLSSPGNRVTGSDASRREVYSAADMNNRAKRHRIVPVGLPRASDLKFPLSRSAAADHLADRGRAATQVFMLMGTLVMLPIILSYMIFVYWIFGGKLREREDYH